jgi:hypothetical protein
MVDWLRVDRTAMLRDVIAAYEDEITIERSRLQALRDKLVSVQAASGELHLRGAHHRIHIGVHLVEHQLKHRIEATEHQIKLMERILAHFREDLAQQELAEARPE